MLRDRERAKTPENQEQNENFLLAASWANTQSAKNSLERNYRKRELCIKIRFFNCVHPGALYIQRNRL
jgi:hypothetical protein